MKTSTSVGGVWSQTSIGSAGAAMTSDDGALGLERSHLAGRRVLAEELGGVDAADVEPAAEEAEADARGILAVAGEDALQFRPACRGP